MPEGYVFDAPVGAEESLCRVDETIYGLTGGLPAGVQCQVTRLLGVEISRRYSRDYVSQMVASPTPANIELASSEDEIVCTVAGAAYNANTNLITRRTYERQGAFAGRIKSVLRPDGTLTTYGYALAAGATDDG